MTLNDFIAALQVLRDKHGCNVDVTVWQYGGGLDDLCNADPIFDTETQTVVLDVTGRHSSGARR